MVPAHSIKVSRVSMYSGFRHVSFPFAYGAFTLCGRLSQNLSARIAESIMRSEPRCARTTVWPLSRSLAATYEIDVSFSSSPYLDVSVQAVPFHTLWIGVWMTGVCPAGFPHSDICGSGLICSSPQLFAAYHVFLRLLVPRHPPCALFCLTIVMNPRFITSRYHSVDNISVQHISFTDMPPCDTFASQIYRLELYGLHRIFGCLD